MKSIRFIILLMPLFLSGCFGLAVGTYGKHEHLSTSFSLAFGKNKLEPASQPKTYSEEEIVRYWGKPDAIENVGSCRILKYRGGLAWSGVGAFVIIVPIPLLAPTGHYEKRFYIRDGRCMGLVSEYGEVAGIFGYMAGDNGGKFYAGDAGNGPRKVSLDFCK